MAANFDTVGPTVIPESADDICKSAARRLVELATVLRAERSTYNASVVWDEERSSWLERWIRELKNELAMYVYAIIEATSDGSWEIKGLVRRLPRTPSISDTDRSATPIENVRVVVTTAFPWNLNNIPIKTEGVCPAEEAALTLAHERSQVHIEELVLRPDAWLRYSTNVPEYKLLAKVQYSPPRDLIDWYIYSFPALHCLFGENSMAAEVIPPDIKKLIWRALHGLPI